MAVVGSSDNGSQGEGPHVCAAAGAEAGHGKGAQGRVLGLGHWTAHSKGGSGGKEMNEDECLPLPPFYKLVGQLKGP